MAPEKTQEDLIVAWIDLKTGERESRPSVDDDPNWWAFGTMWEIQRRNPEFCLDIIVQIMNRTSDEDVLGALSAGPLEGVLAMHGEKIIDRVEDLAEKDTKFRELFAGVWRNGMTDEIWRRVEALRKRAKDERRD
ncbi:MAG TPA: hypothetical protein VHZ78_00025 [Rhizomicrobium sp.]|jgi:hypothetical protein|nr:hypothetical protein [Rhizomicrobium sp.]